MKPELAPYLRIEGKVVAFLDNYSGIGSDSCGADAKRVGDALLKAGAREVLYTRQEAMEKL
jgi:hypothetical protein